MASTDPSNSGGGKPMLARQRAKEEAEADGRPPPAKGGYFPLSYREGFSQWWASLTPAQTEHRVLSFIPYLQLPPTHTHTGTTSGSSLPPSATASTMSVDSDKRKEATPVRTNEQNDPHGPRQWNSQLVQLAGKNRFLNEFSVERVGEEEQAGGAARNSLVMLHGYGAGLGFFYKNFEALSRLPNWKLYALDLLGMGRSSRPPFKIGAKDKEAKIQEAENWFIDALEEWRIKRGIEKMTLLGHSLGGYMAVCYALKYPGHLNKLILASPVGVPENPYAMNDNLPEPSESTLGNEFTLSQDETVGATPGDNNNFLNARSKRENAAAKSKKPVKLTMPWWAVTLWDANISPFSFVRLTGPLGPRLVSGWTSRRFSHLPEAEAQALHDYSYSLFRQRGSGEYALAYVLAPGAYARSPLVRRIEGVGRQFLGPHSKPEPDGAITATAAQLDRVRETGVPIVFMYGDKDWMDVNGGRESKTRLEAARAAALKNASPREQELENGSVSVKVIKNAGHHVYLDGADEFNEIMLEEMKDVERRQARLTEVQ